MLTGIVQRVEPKQVIMDLGRTEAVLPITEQIPTERYRPAQRLKVYLLEVHRTMRGTYLVVSRAHRNLLRRLLELEVPEIYTGLVEIRAVAREPGSRSKVAVVAHQEGIDPVGACIGLRGIRIQNVVNELAGEKIDIIEWDPDPAAFIAKALSPAQVLSVSIDEAQKTARLVVGDRQLSLAIGKDGQNARLAAKLTNWRIDIRSQSTVDLERGEPEAPAAVEAEPEPSAAAAAPEAAVAEVAVPETVADVVPAEAAERVAAAETVEAPAVEAPPVLEPVAAGKPAAPALRFREEVLPARESVAAKKGRRGARVETLEETEAPVKAAAGKGKRPRRGRFIAEDDDDLGEYEAYMTIPDDDKEDS
jgi:N utilization substance protein A